MKKIINLIILWLVLLSTYSNAKTIEAIGSGEQLSLQAGSGGNIVLGSFTGVLRASSGVVSAGDVDLTTEVTGLLPLTNVENIYLSNLFDLNLTALADGEILEWDTATSKWINVTKPISGVSDHTGLTNIGTNTHAQIDTHIADATIHFTEGSIDHTALLNIGTKTHAQLETDIATNVTNIGTNTTDIGTNATNIGNNATNISANTATGLSNSTGVSTNVTNIGINATNISTNASNITANANAIANQTLDGLANVNVTAIADTHVLEWDTTTSKWINVAQSGGSGGGISGWITATVYAIDDVVHESNRIYLALTNHTSGTFATDLAVNAWVEMSDQVNVAGSTTDNALVRTNGTAGDAVQDSGITISDADVMAGASIDGATNTLTNVPMEQVIFPSADEISGPVTEINNAQEMYNHVSSSGIMDGCEITDNGDGTVDIASGYASLRASSDPHTKLYHVNVAAQAGITLTDAATNYIYIDYNAGTPTFNVSTSQSAFNCIDKCIAYVVTRNGNDLSIIDALEQNVDGNRKTRRWLLHVQKFAHQYGGTAIAETGTRNVSLTSGRFYFMMNQINHTAFDTSGADTFVYHYKDASGWQETSSATQIDNTQYNDVGVGLTALTTNTMKKVDWVYLELGNTPTLHVVYSQDEYPSLADAEIAGVPTELPPILAGTGQIVGKIIYKKNGGSAKAVYSVFDTVFTTTEATTHNGLSGLQGGTAEEYYHFDATEYGFLENQDQSVLTTSDVTFSNLTLGATEAKLSIAANIFTLESLIASDTMAVKTASVTSGHSGVITLTTGHNSVSTTTGTGSVQIKSGDVQQTGSTGPSGTIVIYSGSTVDGDTGPVFIGSGTPSGSGTRGTMTLTSAIDGARLDTQPTGGTDLAIATTKYVDDNAGGGGSLLNLIVDPSFETDVSEGTCTTCTATSETTVVELTSLNIKSLKMVFTGSGDYTDTTTTNSEYTDVLGLSSARIKTTDTDVEFCSIVDGAESHCVAVNSDDVWNVYKVNSTMSSTSYGYRIKKASSGTVYADEIFAGASELEVVTTQGKAQTYDITQAASSMTNLAAEIEFALGSATISDTGEGHLVASDDSGNTRTKFTAQSSCSPCSVVVTFSATTNTAADPAQIRKNGVVIMRGQEAGTVPRHKDVSTTINMIEGDYITVGMETAVYSTAALVYLNFTATPQQNKAVIVSVDDDSMTDWETVVGATSNWSANGTHVYRWRKVGGNMEVQGIITMTSDPAGTLEITIPNSKVINTSNLPTTVANYEFGPASWQDATNSSRTHTSGAAGDVGGQNAIRVRYASTTSMYIGWGNANLTTSLIDTSDVIHFRFSVPIVGWSSRPTRLATVQVEDQDNLLTADVDGTGVVSYENIEWITSCTNATPIICTVAADINPLTDLTCDISTKGDANRSNEPIYTSTTIGIDQIVVATNSTTPTKVSDSAVGISCVRKGAAYRKPQAFLGNVTLTNYVSTPSATKPVVYSFHVDSAGTTVTKDNGSVVNSCSSDGVGNKHCDFISAKFSTEPTCTSIIRDNNAFVVVIDALTKDRIDYKTVDSVFGVQNSAVDIICHGVQ